LILYCTEKTSPLSEHDSVGEGLYFIGLGSKLFFTSESYMNGELIMEAGC
jgi:hypothetical protein